jgi:DNA (cytosine-5)-methyltransferase 1
MQIVDLFAGMGGFSVAGHAMGWHTVQMVEINPFCQSVLAHNFPHASIHGDIKTFGIETLKKSNWDPSADTIVCGGFP